ncbi:MAG TPA: 16S rRNA (cytosine(1402)-N(4))-methyltransferase RsmH [candidate division Zixibacteria bacterium]|nr:16S rRNA (cytosine(1402)-N(4))-methyltransferase RsmH [candidate division Zixibacteria bacterium]
MEFHHPVMCNEVVDLLGNVPGDFVIDATLGDGGHAEALLEYNSNIVLLGIDRDASAIERSYKRLSHFGDRVKFVEGRFANIAEIAMESGFGVPAGVLFDLGVSSPQIDEPERGFSFSASAPLDMRMGEAKISARGFIESVEFGELARVLREFGEVSHPGRVARAIIEMRDKTGVETTEELAKAVKNAIPNCRNADLARVFQAIRIFINDELTELRRGLSAALDELIPDGVIVVISYHSLEDRIVKRFFAGEEKGCICPPELPVCRCGHLPRIRRPFRKPMRPSEEEIRENNRARSAKLRAAVKI